MRRVSFLLLLLFSLPLLSNEAFTHTGWNDLRIGRHYAEVSQLLRPSGYAIPYISQLAWRQYYYNEDLNISHEELKRPNYSLVPNEQYNFYMEQQVSNVFVEFDNNERISSITILFRNESSCKVANDFYKAINVKRPKHYKYNCQEHITHTKDGVTWEFLSGATVENVMIGNTLIRYAAPGSTFAEEMRSVKARSKGVITYTNEFNGFDVFQYGKTRNDLKDYLEPKPGFSYRLQSGIMNSYGDYFKFEPDCYHPKYSYNGWKKYDSIDVIGIDLIFDQHDTLREIQLILRDTPANRERINTRLTAQFGPGETYSGTKINDPFFQSYWRKGRRMVQMYSPGAGNRLDSPRQAVMFLTITESPRF